MFPIPFNFPFRKKDGSLITIDDAISSGGGDGYTLPTASAETKGGIKIGSGLSMSGEVLNNSNPTPYSLPTASAETLGGVKVGSGLAINDGVLSSPSKWVDVTSQLTFDTHAHLKEGALFKNGDILTGSLRIKIDTDSALKDGGVIFNLPEGLRPSRAFLFGDVVQCQEAQGGTTYTTISGVAFIRNTGNVECFKYGNTYALDTVWLNFVLVLNHNIPD